MQCRLSVYCAHTQCRRTYVYCKIVCIEYLHTTYIYAVSCENMSSLIRQTRVVFRLDSGQKRVGVNKSTLRAPSKKGDEGKRGGRGSLPPYQCKTSLKVGKNILYASHKIISLAFFLFKEREALLFASNNTIQYQSTFI